MSRISGSLLQIVVGLALVSALVLGAMATQDESAPEELAVQDSGEFPQPDGPPGSLGPGGPPGGFGPGTFLAHRILEAADSDTDDRLEPEEAARAAEQFVRDADTAKKGWMDVGALREAISRRLGPPPGFDPDDAGGGPPPGFGPGMFLAPQVMALADANKDDRLTPEEAARAAEQFVRDAGRDRRGSIDDGLLASAMHQRIGPPPDFGPGGPGGPMGVKSVHRPIWSWSSMHSRESSASACNRTMD
jgi:hypothetical protein